MSTKPQTIEVHSAEGVAVVWLNRPAVRNAINEVMVTELTQALDALDRDDAIRAVVLAGRGDVFCGGGDLKWMQRMGAAARKINVQDAERLTHMFHRLCALKKPTIARVHGAAYAGALGLIAACDIAVASQDAQFCLSEAKLGLAGVSILPYLAHSISERHLRRYLLSAEVFSAADAYRIGLVHELAIPEELDAAVGGLLEHLVKGGPAAQTLAKELLVTAALTPINAGTVKQSAHRFAELRASPEAREGMAAFLDKRTPAWLVPSKPAPRRPRRK
jgi:methylglutaconyl-CoA hydratase